MSEHFYPDSVWNISPDSDLTTHLLETEGDYDIYWRPDHGMWSGETTNIDLGATQLGYLTDNDNNTKITCWSLMWLSYPGYQNGQKWWGWWLKAITNNPRLCDSVKFTWSLEDNDVKRFQVKILPSGQVLDTTFNVTGVQETVWSFAPQVVESVSIRFMNYGTVSNDWNAYVHSVEFGAKVTKIKERVLGQVIRIGHKHFSNELILGGIGEKWSPLSMSKEPEPIFTEGIPEVDGEPKVVWMLDEDGVYKMYWLMPDGTLQKLD